MVAPALDVQDVTVRFGGLTALDGLTFTVSEREIIGVLGPNGAGKTTLFNVLSGAVAPATGRIVFGERDVTAARPHVRSRLGLSRTYQTARPFGEMSTLENVLVGATFGGGAANDADARRRAGAALDFVALQARSGVVAADLTLFERRLLEIARSLATGPRVILLDEPLAGLLGTEMRHVTGLIRRMRDELGMTVLWIEHVMRALRTTCDRALALHRGRLLAAGAPDEVVRDAAVVEAYLGRRRATVTS
jgi:branched-chain amino acid transport system ATP-binding protein